MTAKSKINNSQFAFIIGIPPSEPRLRKEHTSRILSASEIRTQAEAMFRPEFALFGLRTLQRRNSTGGAFGRELAL